MSDQLPKGVSPGTFALHGAYNPALSEGALKPPLFQTSTFVARTAAELAQCFVEAYGLDGLPPRAPQELVYSRVGNPNLHIFEERWSRFEGSEASALFGSGMAAISTTMLTFLRPGDYVIYTTPVYGGTAYLMEHVLPAFGIKTIPVPVTWSGDRIVAYVIDEFGISKVKVIFMESPANPTLKIADIKGLVSAMPSGPHGPKVIVDSTVLGPLFMRPLDLGADIVLHSATKSIGGHSDLTAGIAAGSKELIGSIKAMRTIMGTMCGPQTAWLLTRSLETYKIRVDAAQHKALKVARFLKEHESVLELLYPGTDVDGEPDPRFQTMCRGSGSLMSFRVKGGKDAAYRVLDALRVIKLAVSLGGTESLAEHPGTHTHSDIPLEARLEMGITEDMIRLSVGMEDADDVINDLAQALARI
jgi:methionine-gamma-lyase